ncbi:MAG: hypothetical protein FJ297_10190 [Planctomycetes bacterium]|nr:hypothetical protein [Planctomycetota bacterium]
MSLPRKTMPSSRAPFAVVSLVAALVLAGTATLLTRPFWYLPHPDDAGPNDLLRWIALREVDQYPRELQVHLIDRLESEVDPSDVASTSKASGLARYFTERIDRNCRLLTRVWFETRCERYAECDHGERVGYLCDQIRFLLDWGDAIGGRRASRSSSAGYLDAFIADVERWTEESPEAARDRMRDTVRDAVICWLATHDLDAEPLGTRRTMARAVCDHLGKPQDGLDAPPLELDNDQCARFRSNAITLARTWLEEQAVRFAGAAAPERERVLDECVERLDALRASGYLALTPPSSASRASAASIWTEIPRWIASVDPNDQASLSAFMAQLQARFMTRWWKRVWSQATAPRTG